MTISNCETTSSNHAVKLQMKNENNIYYSYATLFISFAACVLEPVLAGAKYANALSIVPVSPSPVGPTVITKVNQGGRDGEEQYDEEKIMFRIHDS